MPKILLLVPQNVIPPSDGGRRGIYFPMEYLSKTNEVKAIIFVDKTEEYKIEDYKKINVEAIFLNIKRLDSPLMVLKNIFKKLPLKFCKYYYKAHQQYIDQICKDWQPDFIICHHAHLASYLKNYKNKFPAIKLFLREHNVEYLLVQQYAEYEKNVIKKWVAYWQYNKTKKIEKNSWEYFHEVLFISDSDVKYASESNFFKKHVLYDSANSYPLVHHKKEKVFLFAGNIFTIQNRINIKEFIIKVWLPWKKKYQSEFKLWITGTNMIELSNLLNFSTENLIRNDISAIGFVDNILNVMQSTSFFLSPTYIGAGIRVKVVEALAAGCVIFLTEKDESMLSFLKDSENVIVFSDCETFNEQFLRITNDNELYSIISNNALKASQQFLSREKYYQKLDSILNNKILNES